ncbi:MAG: serine hydrolase [Clostridia bacterium]|nr:serine hydrolase [Clostridia bacterium]
MQQLEHVRFPEEAGISSRGILNYIAAREEAGLEHHAIWVLRHGKVAAKLAYAPFDDRTPHMLFSLSKSFCSAAAGFAVQEGLLTWDTKLIDVLPEAFPEEPSDWQKAINMHHLLTMGAGLKPESDGGKRGPDWAKQIIACGCDHEPGTHFAYNSMSTYLVSCMVQKVTGMTVRDYLIPRLFEPLGMMNEDGSAPSEVGQSPTSDSDCLQSPSEASGQPCADRWPKWDSSPDGINVGGWGLWLSAKQIAPFGQCLLQKGMWDGKQILPREWLDLATTFRIDNGNGDHPHDHDWNMGYGYQFWMCKTDHGEGQKPRFRGDGAFSQFCIVDEKRDMVIACVSGVPDIGKALDLIYAHLLAAADMEPADEATQAELQQKLAALSLPWPEHDGSELPVGVYASGDDGSTLTIESDRVTMPLDKEQTALFYVGRVEEGGGCVSCCGMKNGELKLLLRVLNAPFTLDMTVRFDGDKAELTIGGVGQNGKTYPLEKK